MIGKEISGLQLAELLRLNRALGSLAVINAADPQFSPTNDLLEGVITAGRAIRQFRQRVVSAGADQTAANEWDFFDSQLCPLKPTANHRGLESEEQLLRPFSGLSRNVDVHSGPVLEFMLCSTATDLETSRLGRKYLRPVV